MFAGSARIGRRLRWLFAVSLLLFLPFIACGAISIPAPPKEKSSDKKKVETPLPPQPVPVTIQVANGGAVQVPLRIYGKQEQETGYVIRKEPTLGKILGLQRVSPEVWVLTYQHNATKDPEISQQDRILFAAQNKKGISAAVEIVVNIVDNVPVLSAPESIEFGKIAVGIPTSRIVTVSNRGGGLLEGTVAVDPPWSIEPAAYSLRRGEKALFRVTLTPKEEREYGGNLHFLAENNLEAPLHANAAIPFGVEQEEVELTGAPARLGDITLSNRSDLELTVRVEANPRLHLPAQVVLPSKKTQTISAVLAADDPWKIDDTVRFSLGSFTREVRVTSVATGPQVRVEQSALEFEKVVSGSAKTLTINVTNGGGTRAKVDVQIPAPFRTNVPTITVEAGKSAELLVTLNADAPGAVSASLNLTGGGLSAAIALRGEVTPRKPSPPPRQVVTARAVVPSTSPEPASKPDVDTTTLNAVIANAVGEAQTLPGINGLELKRATPGTAELAWLPLNGLGEVTYRVEVRRLSTDANGALLQNWIPVPGVRFTKKPSLIAALITDIPPGISVTARIVALSAQAAPCAVSPPLHFYVPTRTVFLTWRNTLLAGFGILLVVGGVLKRRQKSNE